MEQAKIAESGLEQDSAFWKAYLAGPISLLDIGSLPRPINGGLLQAGVDRATADLLRENAKKHKVSLFVYMLSVFAKLLLQLSKSGEVVIGIPVSAREHPDLDVQFGNFLNILPLRIAASDQDGSHEFLRRVGSNALKALEHKSYPFQMMVADKGDKPDMSRSLFFDVTFTVVDDAGVKDMPFKVLKADKGTSKYDISVFIYDDENLELAIEYKTDIITPTEMKEITDRYLAMLPEPA